MVQGLVDRLVVVLRQALAAEIPSVDDHVVTGPVSPPAAEDLPRIALTAGAVEFSTRGKDEGSSQPRPEAARETIAVDLETPAGPYPLAQTPLEGSMRCRAVFEPGELGERGVYLREGDDFTVDLGAPAITFTYDLSAAGEVRLAYSFVGVFAVRELRQDVVADVWAADTADAERFASLVAAVVLTSHDELLEHVNQTAPTTHTAGGFATRHAVDRLTLLDGALGGGAGTVHRSLRFQAAGRLRATRALEDGFGLIERVHSPGVVSAHPVDIEPELG